MPVQVHQKILWQFEFFPIYVQDFQERLIKDNHPNAPWPVDIVLSNFLIKTILLNSFYQFKKK